MKPAIFILVVSLLVCAGALARGPEFEEPDCYWEAGRIECESPSSSVGRMISKAIVWLVVVIGMPAFLLRTVIGAIRESRLSDDEWNKRYPHQKRNDSDRKIGAGTYFMIAYLGVGAILMWLVFVSPATLKWLGLS